MPVKTIADIEQELHEIIEAVEQAANWGMSHRDQPQDVERSLQDCEELLGHVMSASILER